MKNIFYILIFLLISLTGFAQQTSAPRLIVRGDDMGCARAVNEAMILSYQNGIQKSVEVMVVGAWFTEAVKLIKENPGMDAGLHFVITSEWENIKWKPLTHCPSLTDKNGYFLPMMHPNKNYTGLSIVESNWNIEEIEREFRAQIELALKEIPTLSHITGHMGSTTFDKMVQELSIKLGKEYNLPVVSVQPQTNYNLIPVGYDGPKKTAEQKINSFISMLNKLENGKSYIFLDHPGLDNQEMRGMFHIGYEDVATDRQGVTDLFTSDWVKEVIREKGIQIVSYNDIVNALPRSTPEAEGVSSKAVINYLDAVDKSGQAIHSLMIVRHGKVVAEGWWKPEAADKRHIMNSVSKSFTATAIGFAVSEGLISVTDKVISFFPDMLPGTVSANLAALEIQHLLSMSVGQSSGPMQEIRKSPDWTKTFLATPIDHEPGSVFLYNSMATYMLSAIIHKVTGLQLIDYLQPRLFQPLGIQNISWDNSPEGINVGGWGLYLKTEDMAKFGQLFLQKGMWKGKQLLPKGWVEEASTLKIYQEGEEKMKKSPNDWNQGYGYQMWRSRHHSYRADGANGQFILVLPELDAVIVTTAHQNDMAAQIDLIWKKLLPAIKSKKLPENKKEYNALLQRLASLKIKE